MAHAAHAPDTLFVVSEPDFVFFREDGERILSYMSLREAQAATFARWDEMADDMEDLNQRNQFRREIAAYCVAYEDDKNAPWPKTTHAPQLPADKKDESWNAATYKYKEQVNVAFSRPSKPPASAFRPENISDHLHDLQALMTASARAGRGGFLWCGWNAVHWSGGENKQFRKRSPATGAHLWMITAECARKLLPLWHAVEQNTHMGHFFANYVGMKWQKGLGAAYVWPPIGGFFTHPSTTERKRKSDSQAPLLQDHFEHSWCQAGSRKMNKDQVHRRLCAFTDSGPCHFLSVRAVELPDELPSLRWLTQAPPHAPAYQLGWCYYHEGLTPKDKPQTED